MKYREMVSIDFTPREIKIAYDMAKLANLGGNSQIRGRNERMRFLSADQFVGVGLGELAGNKHFFSVDHYIKTREFKNKHPKEGDKGSDSLGYKIDYKATRAVRDFILYHSLLVRPHERHDGFVYVLVVVRFEGTPEDVLKGISVPEVYLVGWLSDDMWTEEDQEQSGEFGPNETSDGAFRKRAPSLLPIRELTSIPKFEE